MTKYLLQDCFNDVSGLINKEQNQYYPPKVFSSHFNIATSFILGELARVFPSNQSVIEIINPFYKRKVSAVENGIAVLDADYSHLLSIGIGVNDSSVCGCTPAMVKVLISASLDSETPEAAEKTSNPHCKYRKVSIVSDSEFDRLSASTYKSPSVTNAIAKNISNKQIQILPKSVSHAEFRYIKQPKQYQVGYKVMPDDTWQIDPNNPNHVESEWNIEARHLLVPAIAHLYSMYVQDQELMIANNELKKLNLIP